MHAREAGDLLEDLVGVGGDAAAALEAGAAGIGLFRSEFLFMHTNSRSLRKGVTAYLLYNGSATYIQWQG